MVAALNHFSASYGDLVYEFKYFSREGGYCGPYNLRAGAGTGCDGMTSAGAWAAGCRLPSSAGERDEPHRPWGTTSLWNKLGGTYAGKWISDAFV